MGKNATSKAKKDEETTFSSIMQKKPEESGNVLEDHDDKPKAFQSDLFNKKPGKVELKIEVSPAAGGLKAAEKTSEKPMNIFANMSAPPTIPTSDKPKEDKPKGLLDVADAPQAKKAAEPSSLFSLPATETNGMPKIDLKKQESKQEPAATAVPTLKKNASIFGSNPPPAQGSLFTNVAKPEAAKTSLFDSKPPAPGGLFTIPEKPSEESGQLESGQSENLGKKPSLFDAPAKPIGGGGLFQNSTQQKPTQADNPALSKGSSISDRAKESPFLQVVQQPATQTKEPPILTQV